MKAFQALLLLPLTLLSCVQAQNSTEILEEAMSTLPKCALDCMITSISKSSCELTDFYCITRNKPLEASMTACIKSTCTVRQSLTAKNFTETAFGGEARDRSGLVLWAGVIGGALAILAVLLRIVARLPCLGGTWGLDDWGILVAMLPVLPLTFLAIPLSQAGLGKDMWTVPFEKITRILYIYYFDESLYLSSIALTKVSILLFYLRIFPDPTFRRCVYFIISLCTLYILAFVPGIVFQCLPIHISWERWDGEHTGKCINLNGEGWSSAAFNIIMDIVVICLPMRELSKLAMSRRRKAGIMLMFLMGGFVTVVSMLRLKWMIQFANTENVTWDYTPVGYWSTIEVHTGIVVACLPAIRSLQHRLFPDSKTPPSYYNGHSGAYGYNSKGGSPFPSMGKFKKGTGHTTEASQASMIKSRDRNKADKEFIQLDEYEIMVENDNLGRGQTTTEIERGSLHHSDIILIQHPPPATALPPPPVRVQESQRNESSWTSISQGIMVRKEYNVNVEDVGPESLSSSPPRVSEDRVITRKDSQNFSLKRGKGEVQ